MRGGRTSVSHWRVISIITNVLTNIIIIVILTIVMSVAICAQAIRAISNFVWEQRQHGRREGLRHADV